MPHATCRFQQQPKYQVVAAAAAAAAAAATAAAATAATAATASHQMDMGRFGSFAIAVSSILRASTGLASFPTGLFVLCVVIYWCLYI